MEDKDIETWMEKYPGIKEAIELSMKCEGLKLSFKEKKSTIFVWKFDQAPAWLQALSIHGGDEDWIAIVPAALKEDYIPWLSDGSPFGCSSVSKQKLPDGSEVYIGCHA